jgi:drug/metabolite transporter (DMT)-like permease
MDRNWGAMTALVAVGTVALFFAGNDILVVLSYGHGMTPGAMIVVRNLVLALGLLIVAPSLGQRVALPRRFWRGAIVAGGFSYGSALGLNGAFYFLPVGLSLLIFYVYPLLTALGEAFLDGRRVRPFLILCLALAFAGLAFALGVVGGGEAPRWDWRGIGLAVFGAASLTGFFLWSRTQLAGAPAAAAALTAGLTGAVLASLVGGALAYSGSWPMAVPKATDAAGWLWLVGSAAMFGVAYVLLLWCVPRAGGARSSMVLNLETVFAMPLALVVLGETLDVRRLVGAAMVLVAVVASQVFGAEAGRQTGA